MRGERDTTRIVHRVHAGSSPHARGTLFLNWYHAVENRFIPACAGNAGWPSAAVTRRTVHPRMRGDRLTQPGATRMVFGSSPHARGTPQQHHTEALPLRFIPACAGNARSSGVPERAATVHPRMRGERAPVLRERRYAVGSSPHARGTRARPGGLHGQIRFIPACAGNALLPVVPSPLPPVHPRMRGERGVEVCLKDTTPGSSPPARGTPARFAYPA